MWVLVVVLSVALAGCGHRYTVKPLAHIKKTEAQFCEKKHDVELRVKKLDYEETKKLFSGRELERSISALVLTVKNSSACMLMCDYKHIGLPLLSAEELQQLLKKNVNTRVLFGALAFPALVLTGWGILAAVLPSGCGSAGSYLLALTLLGDIFIGIPIIVGVSTSEVKGASGFNAHLSHDIKDKLLYGKSVAPGETSSMLILSRKVSQQFSLALLLDTKETISFNVILNDKK